MEALAVVSLTGNILEFINFTSKLVSKGKELHTKGSLSEHTDLENVTKRLVDFNLQLRESLRSKSASTKGLTKNEQVLEIIAAECTQVAELLLQRLQRLKNEGKQRPWKSFRHALKSVWSKCEIDGLATRLSSYREQLSLQNRVVNEYAACKRFDSLDKTTVQICDRLETLSRTLTTAKDGREAADTSVIVVAEHNKPSSDGVDLSNNDIDTGRLDSARQEQLGPLPSHSAIKAQQFEILQAMIEQLQAQVTELSEKPVSSLATCATNFPMDSQACQVLDRPEGQQASKPPNGPSALLKSIDQLCLFASRKGCALFSEDAQLMIESLDQILVVMEHASGTTASIHSSRKRKRPAENEGSEQRQTLRSIKNVRGLLNSAQSVAVNQPATRPLFRPIKRKYNTTCDHVAIQAAEGEITLSQKKSRLRSSDNSAEDNAKDIIFESFLATVDYTPNGPVPKTKITAVFQQYVRLQNSTSLNPILTYCAMIPDDAKVFEYIKADNVLGVQQLVEQGLASLSDCDSLGRPLLYHAYSKNRFQICKYLVDNQADVDLFCVGAIGAIGLQMGALLTHYPYDEFMAGPDEMACQLACRRIMLEGGADPTLVHVSNTSDPSAMFYILMGCNHEAAKMLLDLAGDFIDVEERYKGRTYALFVSDSISRLDPDLLTLLLHKGVDILARDQRNGQTCLHNATRALRYSFDGVTDNTKAQAFLVILLRNGLKVTDEDDSGISPWDVARQLCHRRRKIFRDALTECGIDCAGLFEDGDECPERETRGQYHREFCHCDTGPEGETFDEYERDQFKITGGKWDSGEVDSDQSDLMGDERFDDIPDQPVSYHQDDTASAVSGQFAKFTNAVRNAQATQDRVQHHEPTNPAWLREHGFQEQAQSSRPQRLDRYQISDTTSDTDNTQLASYGASPSEQSISQRSTWYRNRYAFDTVPTIESYQPAVSPDLSCDCVTPQSSFLHDDASRTPTAAQTSRTAPNTAASSRGYTYSYPYLPELSDLYTYSSASAWASTSQPRSHSVPNTHRTPTDFSRRARVEELPDTDL